MLKKLIAVGVFCAIFLTQVLMGVADAAPKMAQNQYVVREESAPESAAGTVMQARGFTYVYAKAATSSAKVMPLGPGNLVSVKWVSGSWAKVVAAGKTGYTAASSLKAASSASPKAANITVQTGTVMQATGFTYVYAKAATTSTRVLALGKGNLVEVKRISGSWAQVVAAGKSGYMSRAYLTAVNSASSKSASASSSASIKDGTVAQAVRITYVRASATPSGAKLLTLGVGNMVDVKKVQGSWTQVNAAGRVGYTYTSDLKPSTSSQASSSASTTLTKSSTTTAGIYTDQVSKNIIRIKLTSHNGKKLKVMIVNGSAQATYDLPAISGYQAFPLNLGKGTYKISVLENISGTSYKYVTSKTVSVNTASNAAYLISTSEISFNSSMAPIKLAASLTSGKTTSKKVQAVYNWVVKNVRYDYAKNPPAGYVPSIVSTYNTKKGICYDFAALFAAMLRSQGVPTKLVKGYADKVSGYHAWNEVYVDGKWYTVDTSYDAQVNGSMYKTSGYHKTSES